mgnify:CR=1 FL=1
MRIRNRSKYEIELRVCNENDNNNSQDYNHNYNHNHNHSYNYSRSHSYSYSYNHDKRCGTSGITLIALVVTIVVMIVLAGVSINLLTGDNGVITKAKIAKEAQVLSNYQENMNLFATDKGMESSDFAITSLTAYKNKLYYNTKQADDESGIEEVLGNVDDKYIEKMEIINGELCINTTNKREAEAANMAGIKVNPWDIEDGVLLSSDKNLELLGNTDTIVIPPSIKKIGSGAFSGVTNLKKVVIPGTVEEIGDNAFSNNTTLEEVTIEYGVKKVGRFAFKGCSNIKSLEFPDSITEIAYGAMQNCSSLNDLKLSKNMTAINSYLVAGCSELVTMDITEKIQLIGSYAFELCSKLKKLNIPASVTRIDSGAFWGNYNLKDIVIDTESNDFKFEKGFLLSKDGKKVYFGLLSLTALEIPDGVEGIVMDAFSGSNAVSMSLPNSLKELSGYEFTGIQNLKEIRIDSDNPYFKIMDSNLYSKDGKTLYKYLKNESIINVPEGVETINSRAILATGTQSVSLPSTLVNINNSAISGITGLINIPEKVVPFDSSALPYGVKIRVSEANKNIKSVDDIMVLSKDGKILYVASGEEKYNIPDTVETIEENCFYRNSNIEKIDIPSSVKEIRRYAFGYSSLKSIIIPNSVEKIGDGVFWDCTNLNNIIIDKENGSISGSPWGCPTGDRAVKWLK